MTLIFELVHCSVNNLRLLCGMVFTVESDKSRRNKLCVCRATAGV